MRRISAFRSIELMLLDKIIAKIRKEEFKIDPNIPFMYLLGIIFSRIRGLIRGIFCFRKVVFIGDKTKIKYKKKIFLHGPIAIGANCIIDALSTDGMLCGSNVSIQDNVQILCTGSIRFIGKGIVIDDNVGIGANSFLGCAGGIKIGSDTIIGNYVSFHSESHNYSNKNIPIRLQGVTHRGIIIGKNCWIGAKATILDGVTIGNNCIVAAGAVLTAGLYPDNSLIAGVPAKVKKELYE
ncbi:MAG: acyltransferase [Candidatus Thermoplasmatota archaeon]|nr:acyltransferase [Candidatus Thermoplasmatota archaeon]